MDFGLSEEQRFLERTVRDYLAEQVPIERVRALRDAGCPIDREAGRPPDRSIWQGLAELGVTGVLVPEAQGGAGLGLLDAVLVAQSLGHAVTPSAFLSTGVMAPVALAEAGGAAAEAMLGEIASGGSTVALAMTECFSVREGAGVSLETGALHGKAMMVIDACVADRILVAVDAETLAVVSTRPEGKSERKSEGKAAGVSIERLATTDATRCTAEVVFEGVIPEAVFEGNSRAIERALAAGRIALAADAFGAAESMIEQAVEYAKHRKQFDRAIGSFQAVKHLCAEMIAELEPTRSLLWYAAHAFDVMPAEAPLLACHVLAHVSEIGREIASTATQVHGGIGWTDEQNLHFWYKRIAGARHLLGGPELLRERAASLQSFDVAS